MCSMDKPEAPPPPPPPPPPPKPVDFGGATSGRSAQKKSSNARKSLSIPLTMGGTGGASGLNGL